MGESLNLRCTIFSLSVLLTATSNLGKLRHNGFKSKVPLFWYSPCFFLQSFLQKETAALACSGEKTPFFFCNMRFTLDPRLAATLGSKSAFRKLPKRSVLTADISQLCGLISQPAEPLALRLSSNLMFGVVR